MIKINEALGELVQIPVLLGVVVNPEPCSGYRLTRSVRLAEIARQVLLRNPVAAAAQQT